MGQGLAENWKCQQMYELYNVVPPHDGMSFSLKKEALTLVTTGMDLEHIMLIERSQTPKATGFMILCI